jgi:hypothetical protein
MQSDRFAPLKEIDSFTTEMFNRIIAFQEKEHPAWNPQLDFSVRIKNLPLHNLIFSNPDRDPEQYGPTIASYFPLRTEMQRLAHYARQIRQRPQVVDWFPGNGFIGSLLAREQLQVSGISNNISKPNQIDSFFDPNCYQFINLESAAQSIDMILASWIPSQINPTPKLLTFKPSLIAYIYTDHVDPHTGMRQTGTNDMFDALNGHYRLLDVWSVTRPGNLLHEIWPDMTPNIEETRVTKIYASNDIVLEAPPITDINPAQPITGCYDWEIELQFALLALEAKQELRARGVRV